MAQQRGRLASLLLGVFIFIVTYCNLLSGIVVYCDLCFTHCDLLFVTL